MSRVNTHDLVGELAQAVDSGRIRENENLAQHCSFRTGGPADLFIEPRTETELRAVIRILRSAGENTFFLGRGTNLLIGDGGYRGAVVSLCRGDTAAQNSGRHSAKCSGGQMPGGSTGAGGVLREDPGEEEACRTQETGLTDISVEGTFLRVGAGATLHRAALAARDAGLTGLEFAAGIPGSVGGGIVMNAGAYGGEISGVTAQVRILTPTDAVLTKDSAEMAFGYRTSLLKKEPGVVLSAVFSLESGEKEQITAKIAELTRKRKEKQPLEFASAGSTFKRPEGFFAGKLIQDAGLSGYRIGDAQVSEKHCGFVINRGGASAAQVRSLIEEVQRRVLENSGVQLEREVIFLGDF